MAVKSKAGRKSKSSKKGGTAKTAKTRSQVKKKAGGVRKKVVRRVVKTRPSRKVQAKSTRKPAKARKPASRPTRKSIALPKKAGPTHAYRSTVRSSERGPAGLNRYHLPSGMGSGRSLPTTSARRSSPSRTPRIHQFNYMKEPGLEQAFDVGDTVEVYCDHEKNRERIRGWVKGIVVQVDNKMVAVQFRSNVFLTDGWMVPDRILWYPLSSEHIRPMPGKKPVKTELIPEY